MAGARSWDNRGRGPCTILLTTNEERWPDELGLQVQLVKPNGDTMVVNVHADERVRMAAFLLGQEGGVISAFSKRLAAATDMIADLRSRLDQLSRELGEANHRARTRGERADFLEVECSKFTTAKNELEVVATLLKEEVADLRARNERQVGMIKNRDAALRSLEGRLVEMKKATREDDHRHLRQRIKDLIGERDALKRKLVKSKTAVHEAQGVLVRHMANEALNDMIARGSVTVDVAYDPQVLESLKGSTYRHETVGDASVGPRPTHEPKAYKAQTIADLLSGGKPSPEKEAAGQANDPLNSCWWGSVKFTQAELQALKDVARVSMNQIRNAKTEAGGIL